ncbi:polyprenyl diphosphate synthase [Streptomyces capparidis]
MQLMPPPLRAAGWALYAAFHTADELIDVGEGTAAERAARLAVWTGALRAEVEAGASGDPVRCAVVDTVLRWGIDPAELELSWAALARDAAGVRPRTWQEWSRRAQDQNTSWLEQGLLLLERAGMPSPVRLGQLAGFPRFLDGLYLTDTLADLAHDLDRGTVVLPAEVLDAHPGAEAGLAARRWTPAVRDLLAHLLERARRWLRAGPGELAPRLHPAAEILLDAVVALFLARLDAVDRAGKAVLHRPSRPGPVTRRRVLGPARARTALLWHLVRVPDAPPVVAAPAPPAPPVRPVRPASAPPRPVPPHPSGARPPDLPPGAAPRHVAIIMDGNGRWAAARGLRRDEGHRAGAEALLEVVFGALEAGLPHLTVYAFSTENWRRPPEEIHRLVRLTEQQVHDDRLRGHDVRLRWIGDEQGLSVQQVRAVDMAEHATRGRRGLTLNVCLNYGGRTELTRAAGAIAHSALAGDLDPARLSPRDLARHLPYPALPDVDLLWRTGGEHRLSNFLPWHTAYAELHFTDTLWPDVDRRDLWQAMTAYARRCRRYGAAPATDPAPPRLPAPRSEPA